jgi:hypothetical protein
MSRLRTGLCRALAVLAAVVWIFQTDSPLAADPLESGRHQANSQTDCPPHDPPRGVDLIVADLPTIENFPAAEGLDVLAVGSTVCNVGDEPASWIAFENQHPVIAQNLYRLQNGRFQQLGLSWVKHGFIVSQMDGCCTDCQPGDSQHLGVGCSDSYRADLNASQDILGPRSEINPHTGDFPYPFTGIGQTGDPPFKRLQVPLEQLPPSSSSALYFMEVQYISADEAPADAENNASYRQISITAAEEDRLGSFRDMPPTVRGAPAIRAWRSHDPEVVETDVRIPGDGLMILAARASETGAGLWEYEYALHNLNSDRAAFALCVPLPPQAAIGDIGFHDVDYHSGEPYSGSDWTATRCPAGVVWSTQSFLEDENANALRWGTLYNFRFTCAEPPEQGEVEIGLFKPGDPSTVRARTVVPAGVQEGPLCPGGLPQEHGEEGCGAGLAAAVGAGLVALALCSLFGRLTVVQRS